ncbi:BrnT family toxin [Propionivibrio sp.]|uniref:BrnT family toxin n=1 Tax=Propionivibrio sp. TaxID=2212460 RepID=UPI003BF07663
MTWKLLTTLQKSASNIELRGLSFEKAAGFDFQSAVIWIDARKAYPEVRISALGLLAGRVHSLVFTETASGIRVISFRKANKREVIRHEQETQT